MKKITKLFTACTILLAAIALSGCSQPSGSGSSDSIDSYLKSDTITEQALVGTWKCDFDGEYYNESGTILLTIKADNTYDMVVTVTKSYGQTVNQTYPSTGTYSLSGDIITTTIDGRSGSAEQRIILKGNKMYLFPYATDEEIKEYYEGAKTYYPNITPEQLFEMDATITVYVKQ